MSPRIQKARQCPHCRAVLPQPTPRVCPECAGSLQKRFLSCGCLTSAPPVLLAVWGIGAHLSRVAPCADTQRAAGCERGQSSAAAIQPSSPDLGLSSTTLRAARE
jgi:hypothetical protein